jgi:hypothetical protein
LDNIVKELSTGAAQHSGNLVVALAGVHGTVLTNAAKPGP